MNDFWKDKATRVPDHKLVLCEDHRLCLMAYVIVQSQCSDIYTSFLALNPFVDFNSMDEAVPMATIENAINVIIQDYTDKVNSAEALSEGPFDQQQQANQPLNIGIPRHLPSAMSESFHSVFNQQHIEGFKRQIEDIKLRQSRIYQASIAGGANITHSTIGATRVLKSFGNNGIPVPQMVSPYEFHEDLNQEEEEEELHRRLNHKDEVLPEGVSQDEQNEIFEHIKQKETLKRWQTNANMRNASFRHAEREGLQPVE